MEKQAIMLVAFSEEGWPVTGAFVNTTLDDADEAAELLMAVDRVIVRVIGWPVDGQSFIDRQAEPILHHRLPWVD